MKKLLIVLLFAIALTSCSKTYECVCIGHPTFEYEASSLDQARNTCYNKWPTGSQFCEFGIVK